jgi:hypothetical protein
VFQLCRNGDEMNITVTILYKDKKKEVYEHCQGVSLIEGFVGLCKTKADAKGTQETTWAMNISKDVIKSYSWKVE